MEREQKKFCNSFVFSFSLLFRVSFCVPNSITFWQKCENTQTFPIPPYILALVSFLLKKKSLVLLICVLCARPPVCVCVCVDRCLTIRPPKFTFFFSSIVRPSTITHTPARCVFVLNVTTSETISVCFFYYPWRCLLSSFLSRSKTLSDVSNLSLSFL